MALVFFEWFGPNPFLSGLVKVVKRVSLIGK